MKIDHIALYTADLEATKHFFEKYFNARPNEIYRNPAKGFSSYFLSFDDGARLEIMHKEGLLIEQEVSFERIGLTHLSFQVWDKTKVDALVKRLVDDGYALFSPVRTTGDGYYEGCIIGPDNILIEITA